MKPVVLASIAVLISFATLAPSQPAPPFNLHPMVSGFPNITVQPQNQTIIAGQTATFTVTATGDEPLGYQWTFNGLNVGSSSSAYTRANCQLADVGGRVQVTISNAIGTVQNGAAILYVATNMALGMSYTLDPAPNYPGCTDKGDIMQLTDGLHVSGNFWNQQGTVGWELDSPVSITLDLGTNEPIAGVSFNTAAGTSGVYWPSGIFVLVSEDSNTWNYAGDLAALSSQPPLSGYADYRYQNLNFATRGRYVKFLIAPTGNYTFVDEIEVYRGPDSLMGVSAPGQVVTNLSSFFAMERPGSCLRRRLLNDLEAVTEQLNSFPTNVFGSLETELNSIRQAIPSAEVVSPDTFTTVFPINDLHRRIFAVLAAVWRANGLTGLVMSQSKLWDMLNPTAMPVSTNANVNLSMMSNEYRAEAFNLSNAGTNLIQVSMVIDGLPGGTNPTYVTVQQAPFTDTLAGIPVAAALPLVQQQAGAWVVQIPPGLTRQIWLTFHPTNVPAGQYSGRVLLKGAGLTNQQVSVGLRIYPFNFPDQPTLHLSGWDYTDRSGSSYGITPTNRPALISFLREHFVDSTWAETIAWDVGKYDQNGNMTQSPNPTTLQTWVNRWPNARNYHIYTDFGSSFADFAIGTSAWQRAVTEWINWLVGQLQGRNIQPNQLSLMIVDEPRTSAQDSIIIQYAIVIHAAQPQVVVWEDPIWADPSQATPELFEVSDVLCANLQDWLAHGQSYVDFFLAERDAGHVLWFYTANTPGRLRDPYYLRMQEWFCWRYGATGSTFWSFVDTGGSSSWNEYSSKVGDYSPFFLDPNSVTDGKQMEAIREGVEDYEYLRMLRDRVKELEGQGNQTQAVINARALLDSAADRVVPVPVTSFTWAAFSSLASWDEPKDRSNIDKVRIEILETLLQLQAQ